MEGVAGLPESCRLEYDFFVECAWDKEFCIACQSTRPATMRVCAISRDYILASNRSTGLLSMCIDRPHSSEFGMNCL
jgi:hypothetical protein